MINAIDQNQDSDSDFAESVLRKKDATGGWSFPSGIQDEINDDFFNESYTVIEFNRNVNRKSLHWIIDKIRGKKANGGADLLIRREPIHR